MIRILRDRPIGSVDPRLHSGFVEHMGRCVNGGVWDGEKVNEEVRAAMAEIAHPVLRWPGGCFADDYRWRDGIGPRADRPVRVTAHWGVDEIDENGFGSHEFVDFCRSIGTEPWFGLNLGVDGPREGGDWFEYANFRGDTTLTRERAANGHPDAFDVTYWGIGNESWDCGGKLSPEDYAKAYRRMDAHLPSFSNVVRPQFVAVGPDGNNAGEAANWTERVLDEWNRWRTPRVAWWDAHFYLWATDGECGSITEFDEWQTGTLFDRAAKLDDLIVQQRAILDAKPLYGRPRIDLCIGEWGVWHGGGPPTEIRYHGLRDAAVCAAMLDTFHRHADKVKMANIAQTVNILGAPINVSEEGVVVRSPIWDVFVMYRAHRGGVSVPMEADDPRVLGSATLHSDRTVVSLVNSSHEPIAVALPFVPTSCRMLAHEDITARNLPDDPDRVRARAASWNGTLPPLAVALLES